MAELGSNAAPLDLAAHAAWIESLARALARDQHAAEDLVQDAYVAALEHPPHASTPLRPWLTRVLRNAWFSRRRGERHRREREREAARDEAGGGGLEAMARLESERLLFEALASLEEPYRSTVVERYLGRASAAGIARRAGLPAATVRWRLQRGLELLRARLAEQARHRGMPLTALLGPLCPPPSAANVPWISTAISGGLAMHASVKLAAGALIALAGVGWWWVADGARAVEPRLPQADVQAGASLESPKIAEPSTATDARDVAQLARPAEPPANEASAKPKSAEPAGAAVEARLIDARGSALEGELGLSAASGRYPETARSAATDVTGRCRLELDAAELRVASRFVVARARHMASRFLEVEWRPGETVALGEIVMEPGCRASGIVLLPDGSPAAGARVVAAQPSSLQDELAAARRGPDDPERAPSTIADATGRFVLEGIRAERQFLWAGHDGMRWSHTALIDFAPLGAVDDVVLKLVALARDDHIAGVVLDPSGAPSPFASLRFVARRGGWMNSGMIEVDAQGRFDHRVSAVVPHDLTASDADDRFASVALAAVAPGTLDVELRLGSRRTLRLEVADTDERPVRRFALELVDPDGYSVLQRFEESERPDGQLDFELPASGISLRVRAPGFDVAELGPYDVETAPASVRALLVSLPGIRGRVVSGEAPVAGARIQLYPVAWPRMTVNHNGFPTRFDPELEDSTVSDADGNFLLTARGDGDFGIVATADGFALTEAELPGFAKLAGRDRVVIEMQRGGALEGRVIVATGRSPEGTIVAIHRGDLSPRTQRVGADGRFFFDRLTPGPWSVRSSAFEVGEDSGTAMSTNDAGGRWPFDVVVQAGETARFDLDLSDLGRCTLSGRLSIDGVAADGWRATLWPDANAVVNETLPTTVLDVEGRFSFAGLDPGFRRLRFAPPSGTGTTITLRCQVARGDNPLERDLRTGTVAGRVPPGSGQRFLRGRFGDDGDFVIAIRPDADGRFTLPLVPAGACSLMASPTPGSGQTGWVEVENFDLAAGATRVIE